MEQLEPIVHSIEDWSRLKSTAFDLYSDSLQAFYSFKPPVFVLPISTEFLHDMTE